MDDNEKKVKDALNQLLKAVGETRNIDQVLEETLKQKLACGHTREEHAAAKFLATVAQETGISPKLLLGAAETLIEHKDALLDIQARLDQKRADRDEDSTKSDTPMVLSPMPKEMQ